MHFSCRCRATVLFGRQCGPVGLEFSPVRRSPACSNAEQALDEELSRPEPEVAKVVVHLVLNSDVYHHDRVVVAMPLVTFVALPVPD